MSHLASSVVVVVRARDVTGWLASDMPRAPPLSLLLQYILLILLIPLSYPLLMINLFMSLGPRLSLSLLPFWFLFFFFGLLQVVFVTRVRVLVPLLLSPSTPSPEPEVRPCGCLKRSPQPHVACGCRQQR